MTLDPQQETVRTADRSWRLAGLAPLKWACWDGECVVYDPFSGDTHYLDVPASEVLRRIETGPQGTVALSCHLARFLEIDDLDTVRDKVDGLLDRLADLGLIETNPSD